MRISDWSSDVCSSDLVLGGFVGVREAGRLVAMAGERLKAPGFTEVSGVCTRPGWRGRGFAAELLGLVARRIAARGETPFLHAYADHNATIALYERLGFAVRAQMTYTVLRSEEHTSELQSLMRSSYAVFCLKKK